MATANRPDPAPRQPIPAGTRRRLQQCFEHGSKCAEKGDFDYATDLFTQCVLGDPGNVIYVKTFLGNLQKKYNHNKKGSKLAAVKGVASKGAGKKASLSKDWVGVIKSGLEVLKHNPWDISTLTAMATACQELGCGEAQLSYLHLALEANPRDAEVNRQAGRALARMGRFDESIACWHRVEQVKPHDEEAQRAIGDLSVEKTIHQGGYEDAKTSSDVKASRVAEAQAEPQEQLKPEQRLEKAITKNPGEVSNYLELADVHTRNSRFAEAEEVLEKALQIAGGDVGVRERWEDAQLRRAREQLTIAERKAQNEATDEANQLARRMRVEVNRLEIDLYRSRTDRYPGNLGLKYELGLRLKRAGKFKEAIEALQQARGEGQRKGVVHLELGECFQHMEHYKLAMSNYEEAISAISEHDQEQRKLAFYRAGLLALAKLRDIDAAEKHLTALASLDFSYKNVSELLDKIAKFRQNR